MKTSHAMALFAATLLVACSSAQTDWQTASASNTLNAYENFLQKHPNTTQAAAARGRIQKLEDEQAWAGAQQTNTVGAFQSYLQGHPRGSHAAEARDRIAAAERVAEWAGASAADTPEALQAFLEKYPQGAEADQARANLAQMTGFRVQLASYRSEELAEKTRDQLQGKYGDLLGSVVVVPEAGSKAHVVRSAPMGEVEANNTCAKLRKAHLTCEVVRDANS
jgi:outer membrane protein assembly factor BamD (BamD/ComL family)